MLVRNTWRITRNASLKRFIGTKYFSALFQPKYAVKSSVWPNSGIQNQPKSVFIAVQRMHNSIAASTDGKSIPDEILDMPIEVYHEVSDEFMDNILEQLEVISDSHPEVINDVEMSQGVMSIEVPTVGIYVINKQPPNKQIWLASPVSGPNRFDYYQKEWISLRDGTKLLDILNAEFNTLLKGEEANLHY